jgi:hypothetical protein
VIGEIIQVISEIAGQATLLARSRYRGRQPGLFMSPGFRDNLLRPNPKRKRG